MLPQTTTETLDPSELARLGDLHPKADQEASAARQGADAARQGADAARQAARQSAQQAAEGARATIVTSTEQVRGLRARRDMLREQLEEATEQRGTLVGQYEDIPIVSRDDVGKGIQARIQQLDGRILQLDRELAQAEHDLAAAPPELLSQTVEVSRGPDMSHYVHEDQAIGISFATFGLGVLLTLFVGRVRGWRRRRRAGGAPETTAPAEDPRIDRLAQALDAVAVEVERIGEGQRFVTQLLAESRATSAHAPALAGAHDAPTMDPAVR